MMFRSLLLAALVSAATTDAFTELRFKEYAGPYAYGLRVASPWPDGGELILNLPEHLERKPGGHGVLRHNDKKPLGHWQVSENGKSAVLDLPSSTIPGVWVFGTANVVSSDRIELSIRISNDSDRALEAVKPLYCHHYASLPGFPQAVRDDRQDFDNFQHTYAVLDGDIVRLSDVRTKEPQTLRKGGTVKGCQQKDTLLERHGGLVAEGVDAAITAVTASDGKRKLVVAWTPGKSVFSNVYIPCLHADPYYGEIASGQSVTATGIVILSEDPLQQLLSGLVAEGFGRYEEVKISSGSHTDQPYLQESPPTCPAAREMPLNIDRADASVVNATVTGMMLHSPELFNTVEDYYNPRLQRLRDEYKLDAVTGDSGSEFERMLRLRNWVHTRWPIDNDQSFSGDTFAILEEAKKGAGFYCTHSSRVQHAAMTAMGYVVRNLGVDCNHEELNRSTHHGVNEVWSNDYGKWILLDAKYDVHYESDGLPLSALEIHEAVRRDGGRDVIKVQGPHRRPVPMKGFGYPASSVFGYWWVAYRVRQNMFTQPHWSGGSRLVIFDNEAFRNTVWFRGGADGSLSPHWAYRAGAFVPTSDRQQIEWTPGVPGLRVRQVSTGILEVRVRSTTPNFKTYLIRIDDGAEQSILDGRLRWHLNKGQNVLEVRSINLFGVSGPEVKAKVQYK
jgi:hypothetical protein